MRIILANCGISDPERIEAYFAQDGYQGLGKALQMSPDEVIRTVQESGLRGRGGAGFNSGLKWEFARRSKATPKVFIQPHSSPFPSPLPTEGRERGGAKIRGFSDGRRSRLSENPYLLDLLSPVKRGKGQGIGG